jgi:two-component system OmpR family response regulator
MGTATLPARGPDTAAAAAPRIVPDRQQKVPRILVVEDEPVTAEVFALALQKDGHRVRIARDGNQAGHALRDHPPDLVVLDMGLPSVPGAELLRRLRAGEHGARVPVIVVSGSERALTAVDDELLRPGCWLKKPLRPRDLVAAVRTMLDAGSPPPAG